MKCFPVLVVATVLALIVVFAIPVVTHARPGDPHLPADDTPTTDLSPRTTDLRRSATAGDYAIYVRQSGTYPDDGVILPVLETLDARYMAAGREFTVEYWFKLGSGYDSNGKELFDHHIPSEEGFWTAFQNGHLWAGIDTAKGSDPGAIHVYTGSGFDDEEWHHYALVRDLNASPDRLCLYLDGASSCYVDGTDPEWAPVSADIRPLRNRDGVDTNNIPLYVIGARTNGGGEIEAVIDELRISDVARYRSDFAPPSAPFVLDASTVMLFHFDEGSGNTTRGRRSDNSPIEGTLVKSFDNYGLEVTPLDPDDPTDSVWLGEMWTNGRFGATTPSLVLTSPNGGELWLTDSQYQIRWTLNDSISEVSLSYSTDGFTSVSHAIVASTPDDGVYTWNTPVTPSKTVRVRVADAGDPAIYDDSDADFTLTDTIYFTYMPVILKSWP
jgi:hypothetical protein